MQSELSLLVWTAGAHVNVENGGVCKMCIVFYLFFSLKHLHCNHSSINKYTLIKTNKNALSFLMSKDHLIV